MSRKRQPVAFLRASGSRHYSKDELAEREAGEVKVPPVETIPPPSYLPASLKNKFSKTSAVLLQIGIMSELDADALARYLLAESNYLRVTSRLVSALNSGNLADADKLSSMQDRFFRQCRAAASDLCLTVSGRCSLLLPSENPTGGNPEEAELFGN